MPRWTTDDELIVALEGVGWVSADFVQRMIRQELYDREALSVQAVGRRLSRLAAEGRVEKHISGGAGIYRVVE